VQHVVGGIEHLSEQVELLAQDLEVSL